MSPAANADPDARAPFTALYTGPNARPWWCNPTPAESAAVLADLGREAVARGAAGQLLAAPPSDAGLARWHVADWLVVDATGAFTYAPTAAGAADARRTGWLFLAVGVGSAVACGGSLGLGRVSAAAAGIPPASPWPWAVLAALSLAFGAYMAVSTWRDAAVRRERSVPVHWDDARTVWDLLYPDRAAARDAANDARWERRTAVWGPAAWLVLVGLFALAGARLRPDAGPLAWLVFALVLGVPAATFRLGRAAWDRRRRAP